MTKTIVTLSFDDGSPEDGRVVALLNKYNLKGTFYIPIKYEERVVDKDLDQVYENHEVGAHTMTHPDLTKLSLENLSYELVESKKYLENILGEKIKIMAYPFGFYNPETAGAVKKAGYLGARTVAQFFLTKDFDSFKMPTTLHIYPYPLRKRSAATFHLTRHLFDPWLKSVMGLRKLGISPFKNLNWLSLARALFTKALEQKGVYHIWL